jgi:uncharacterized protein
MVKNYGIMTDRTTENLLVNIFNEYNDDDVINFAFQGGEPTVAGLDYFVNFVNTVNRLKHIKNKINYIIQTNGTIVDIKWIKFLKENNFLVGISLDGYKENHDFYRIDENGNGTFDKIINTIELLKENNLDFNILTVLTSRLAKDPKKLFDFYNQNNFNYLQLIPSMPELNNPNSDYGLKPKEFYEFYKIFFDLQFEEYKKGNLISETLFDNVLQMFDGYPPIQCGYNGKCSKQLVVESDGTVYPCDFYVLDKYKLGNVSKNTVSELNNSFILNNFIDEKRRKCSLCDNCKYLNICHGQCKRMNVCYFDDNYCGYKLLLEHIEKIIMEY